MHRSLITVCTALLAATGATRCDKDASTRQEPSTAPSQIALGALPLPSQPSAPLPMGSNQWPGQSPALPQATAAPTVSSPSPDPQASPAVEAAQELELQELTFTSEVKNKEPVDELQQAAAGTRVWAHLRVRNRSEEPGQLHVEFRVNGEKRTSLDLNIGKSWSYRTWAYNTLQKTDKGMLQFQVVDASGKVLADSKLPIGANAVSKPYTKKAAKLK